MKEIWKAVTGHEGFYEISSWARVRSLDRLITRTGKGGCTMVQPYKGVLLTQTINADGYHYVHLSGRKRFVHRLVAHAFLPPPEKPQMNVDHRYGNPGKNRPHRLRWATQAMNNRNRKRTSSASGIVGVRFRADRGKWQAYFHDDGFKSLGHFTSKAAAVRARKANQERLGV